MLFIGQPLFHLMMLKSFIRILALQSAQDSPTQGTSPCIWRQFDLSRFAKVGVSALIDKMGNRTAVVAHGRTAVLV